MRKMPALRWVSYYKGSRWVDEADINPKIKPSVMIIGIKYFIFLEKL